MTTKTFAKATSRGQITLPKKWRDKFNTDQYVIKADDFKVEIIPLDKDIPEEDLALGTIARERDTLDAVYVSHEKAWE